MSQRVLVPFIVVVLVICSSGTALSLGDRPKVSPFDGGLTLSRPLPNILPALPLDLGADLSIFGVSSTELATVGPMNDDDEHDETFVVDDDHRDCPTARFSTIQSAVTAASAGDKIRVCRGTYIEQVTIPPSKSRLRLFSTPALAAVIKAPALMVEPKAIVRVNGATNVSIRHFTISGPGSGPCDTLRYGVHVDGGGSALIESNRITLIRNTPLGCSMTLGETGVGVLVGRMLEGQTGAAEISHNLIDRYEKGGVVVDNAGSFGNVHHNRIVGPGAQPAVAPNGIQIGRGAAAGVDHNIVTENSSISIVFGSGILIFEAPANAITVGHNEVYLNDDGISLYMTSGALVEHNFSHDQRVFDGLFANADTSGIHFSYNRAERNAEYDCADDTVGPGTAGTANFWEKNLGNTENRPGLCRAKPRQ